MSARAQGSLYSAGRLNRVAALLSAILVFCYSASAQTIRSQSDGATSSAVTSIPAERISPTTLQKRSSASAMIAPEDLVSLVLAPGFLLNIDILDEPDIAGPFRVDDRGDLLLPVLGSVHVAGQTVSQAKNTLQDKLLQQKLLLDPHVTLTVLEYTAPQVAILGQVASPGRYPLLAPHNLIDVLALAGGPTASAGNQVKITRGSNPSGIAEVVHFSRETERSTVSDVLVQPGDTVQVEMAGIVYVLGAVNKPGGYVMQEGGTLNVLQAISMADGMTLNVAGGTIHILRPNADGSVVDIPLSSKRLFQGETGPVLLQAKDIVYVPVNRAKMAFNNFSGILASAASASIYALH